MRNSTSSAIDLRAAIRERAQAEGFEAVGFAAARAAEGAPEGLAEFLAAGHHGDMAWMATTAERRSRPESLWSEAKSIVTLGANYAPADDPLPALERKERGVVSVYAQGRDYHDVLKARLKRLARWLAETHGGDVKIFVDTAPVMEKPIAAASGIGWQGKHTN